MLRSIGPGMVLDAIVRLGYHNGQHDFDIAHFTKVDGDHFIRLEVTFELRHNATPQEVATSRARQQGEQLAQVPDNLPGAVAELAQALVERGCSAQALDPDSTRDNAVASFERLDATQCLNRLLITLVRVRATRQLRPRNGEW